MSPRPIRRTQSIAPFGVGAMVDFTGPVSLIACGLDAWPTEKKAKGMEEFAIRDEERLAARLQVDYFMLPPDFRTSQVGGQGDQIPNLHLKMPFLRFPLWHSCPRCGRMYRAQLHDNTPPMCTGPVASGKDKGKSHNPRKTHQVRFVAVCPKGHIQDFPWNEWVHRKAEGVTCSGTKLRMRSAGTASLAGVIVSCEECGKTRSLAGAFEGNLDGATGLTREGIMCDGEAPWLGRSSANHSGLDCGEHLHVILRGASNAYFPHVVSSIYIPKIISAGASEEVLEVLDNPHVWMHLSLFAQSIRDGLIQADHVRLILRQFYPEKEISAEEVARVFNERRANESSGASTNIGDDEETAYRRQEYTLFCSDISEGYPKTNLLVKSADLGKYAPFIGEYFDRVSLVHKLRETRALVGFSRLLPDNSLTAAAKRSMLSRDTKKWLPASVVRGEGIFIQLREEKICEWQEQNKDALNRRIDGMSNAFNALRARRRQEGRELTPRLILLHTFAHLFINELVARCGYGSASIRERIYCSHGASPMSGVLIYTAAGDAEGTMGGLVRMGKPRLLEEIIARCIERARWCSTDPVCIESSGQGPDNCNLAACHCCALLPETSCEEGNRLLDRGIVVGTPKDQSVGYFSHLG